MTAQTSDVMCDIFEVWKSIVTEILYQLSQVSLLSVYRSKCLKCVSIVSWPVLTRLYREGIRFLNRQGAPHFSRYSTIITNHLKTRQFVKTLRLAGSQAISLIQGNVSIRTSEARSRGVWCDTLRDRGLSVFGSALIRKGGK